MRLRDVMNQLKGFGWDPSISPSGPKQSYEDLLMEEIWWDGFYAAKGYDSKWNKKDRPNRFKDEHYV